MSNPISRLRSSLFGDAGSWWTRSTRQPWTFEITRRHLELCYALVAGLVAARLSLQGLHALAAVDWRSAGCCDAAVDWKAAKLALEGLSPYEPPGSTRIGVEHKGFGHPPTAAFWFLPFTEFTHAQLGFALALVALLLLVAHVFWCVRGLRFPAPLSTAALCFAFLWRLSGVQLHLTVIQTSIPVATACALAWLLLRRRQDVLGGVALGIACTLKLFPGVFVVFLLLSRRFRAAAAAACCWAAVAAVMTACFGVRAWPQFLAQQGPIARNWIGNTRNASLHGILHRAFSEPCEPAELSETTLRIVTASASIGLLAAALLLLAWRKRRATAHDFDFAWSLLSVVATFVNPWIWSHYVTMLVLPVLFASRRIGAFLVTTWTRWIEHGSLGWKRSLSSLAGVAALGTLTLAVQFQTQDWRAKGLLARQLCTGQLPAQVQAWAERKLWVLEHTNWASWVLILSAVAVVGVLFLESETVAPSSDGDEAA